MSSKKYPYIGKSQYLGTVVFFASKDYGAVINSKWEDSWNEDTFTNITRKYLTNTYGKCESQEHADFICKLAENAGFTPENDYHAEKGRVWFSFNHETGSFFEEHTAKDDNEKLIHLPLPPKEKPMEETRPVVATMSPRDNNPNNKAFDVSEVKETADAFEGVQCSGLSFHCLKMYWNIEFKKPIYTKEMHERGELPPVGSFVEITRVNNVSHDDFSPLSHCEIDFWGSGCVCEVICHTEIAGQLLPVVKHGHTVSAVLIEIIKPIPTIKDELLDIFEEAACKTDYSIKRGIQAILDKYNITKKEDKCN